MSGEFSLDHLPVVQWNRETKSWGQVLERIMGKIEMVTESGCWIWLGATKGGEEDYGRVYFCGMKFSVHRLVYELLKGPVPDGLVLDHLCRVEPCANPWHLEPVTDAVNIQRGNAPYVILKRNRVCLRGHAMEGDNVRVNKGINKCRSCERERSTRRRHALDN